MSTPDDEKRRPFDFDRVMEGVNDFFKDVGASPTLSPGLLVKDVVAWEVMAGDDFVVLRAVRPKSGAVVIEARLTSAEASALGKKLARFAKAAGGDRE